MHFCCVSWNERKQHYNETQRLEKSSVQIKDVMNELLVASSEIVLVDWDNQILIDSLHLDTMRVKKSVKQTEYLASLYRVYIPKRPLFRFSIFANL